MTQDSIKKEILEILQANISDSVWSDSYISIDTLYGGISAPKKSIEKVIKNLHARGCVNIKKNVWTDVWTEIGISDKGIETLENMDSNYETASNTAHNLGHQEIHIHGDVQGDFLASYKGDITKITTVTEAFEKAKSYMINESQILSQDKNQILQHVEILEEESNKINPSKSRIETSWKFIRSNSPRIIESILTKVVAGLLLRAI